MRSPENRLADAARPLSEIKADLFKALGHPARVRILEVLVEGERSVSDLQPAVGIEASHLSQQLAVLRRAGLVTTRKEGSTVIYALKSPLVKKLLATAKQLLVAQLSEARALLDGLRAEAPAG